MTTQEFSEFDIVRCEILDLNAFVTKVYDDGSCSIQKCGSCGQGIRLNNDLIDLVKARKDIIIVI